MSSLATLALSALAEAEDTWRRLDRVMHFESEYLASLSVPDIEALLLTGQMQHPKRLANIPLLWVSTEMVDLLEHAAKTLPALPFNPSTLPWSYAFVVLARPVISGDVALSGITWGPIVAADNDRAASHAVGGLARQAGNFAVVLWSKVGPGSLIGELPRDETLDHDDFDGWARILSALWLLVRQKVAVSRTVQPARPDVRRWDRRHDEPIPEVIVVELRRPIQTKPHDESFMGDVEWSHRWIVDGHWRNQWHPKLNSHVPTWIAPHVKGPEDKPLVVKRHIHAWVR